MGVGEIPVRFVRFRDEKNDRVIVVCPGRIESYIKYAELAYDLFHLGFDVLIIDHRGQGLSGRMLPDTHRGTWITSAITSTIWPRSGSRKCSPDRGASVIFLPTPWGARSRRCFCSAISTSATPLR